MPSFGFIIAIVGASIGMLIGLMLFSEISSLLDCTTVEPEAFKQECENAKSVGWTVIAILPIALFFAIFAIFGGFEFDFGGKINNMQKILRVSQKNGKTKIENITISQKLMLFFGLAKVKRYD
ncbi:MAG TPA: hypothetical protein HA319_06105 [Nitrosopumilaceae archaeon]|nr:hypothetical protein [Nitrosopumilaceae archaeon]